MSQLDLSHQIIDPAPTARARPPEHVAAMAVSVQANLAALKAADAERRGIAADEHPLRVPAPGPVLLYRETLLDPDVVARYGDVERRLRLHEVWGQYCLFAWLFCADDPHDPPDFANCAATRPLRCGAVVEIKTAEIEAFLWRMHYEQRVRHDPSYSESDAFADDARVARRIPAVVFGRRVDRCHDDELLLCGCEYAGMLAAIRWAADDRRHWGEAGIMDVNGRPAVAE